jgi:predicted phosphodiesterase
MLLPFFMFRIQAQEKVTIALWGDSRENLDNACSEIASILLHDITDWDVQVHTGDFTHHGVDKDWVRSLGFPGVQELFVKDRFLMCTSNHDAQEEHNGSRDKQLAWDKHTAGVLPINDADSSTHFFGWHKGNVYIVFCDGYFTDSTLMQQWLDHYLDRVEPQDWLIGVWHNPAYALTYKEAYLPRCREWVESLERHGGDFILNGHAHQYVRTKPLMPDGSVDGGRGMVTIINGTGGASWKDPAPLGPSIAYTPSEKSFPCITFLTLKGNTASVKTVDARPGKGLRTIDEWTWQR